MSTTTPDPAPATIPDHQAKDYARFLSGYAKRFHAGAFATPTGKELASTTPGQVQVEEYADGTRFVGVLKTLTRASTRRDFTARPFTLPAGSTIMTHLAHDGVEELPPLQADYVMAYAEDPVATRSLEQETREVVATRVTAAAEVIHCWGPSCAAGYTYPLWDRATVTPMPLTVPEGLREGILGEVARMTGWDDDFPYYSDGSWSSLSLRGFWPEDPTRGVKPSEMPKTWKEENPEDLARECDWTELTEEVPHLMEFIRSVPWWGRLERLRLLQMSGRGGKGGALGRHTDITDRDSGTADGNITRFHVPLVTDPQIKLHTWHLDGSHRQTHLAEWGCYYLDARKPHAVTNPTGVDRVHLVADVITDPEVRHLIGVAEMDALLEEESALADLL